MRKSIQRLRKALQKELTEIDRQVDTAVRGSTAWRQKEDLMVSVPGVGPAISRTLIVELPEFGALDRRQVAALAGLAPFTLQSGKWRGQARIGGGRASPRAVVFMGAMAAVKHNPILKAFYEHLTAAGKPKMVARKLLTILNAIIGDQKPWQPA